MQNLIREYVEKNIDKAIENEWIKVYYQPVVRSLTETLCGAEALARWIDPEMGFLAPDQFISVLEDTNQIHKLDCFVVERVCRDISERIRSGKPVIPVSVNFSRLDFANCDMLGAVEEAIKRNNVEKDLIHVEITESTIVSDRDFMNRVIQNFQDTGYEIWMDDFGSGYSSLTLLKDYHFNTLKLDMEFLSSFTDKSQAIMRSLVTMAKNIDIRTLAEGVETIEQIEFLREIGCEKLQGYYYGKPMPVDEFFECVSNKKILIERRDWTHYYEAASVNAMATDNSLEIIEDDGIEFRTLFMNEACKMQIFDESLGLEEIDRRIYHTRSPLIKKYREFANQLEETEKEETFYYTSDGNLLCLRAKLLAKNKGRNLIKGSLINISMDQKIRKRASLDRRLRELNHLFEVVLLLNPDEDRVEPLLGRFKYITDIETKYDLRRKLENVCENYVFPEDRDKYRYFTDFSTMRERIESNEKGYVEMMFRMKQGSGKYMWRGISLMIVPGTGGKEYMYCIKDTPSKAEYLFP